MALELSTGTFESTLDEKGRVVIPSCLRSRYAGDLIITQGKHNCAWILTPDAYFHFKERMEQKAEEMSGDEYEWLQYQYIIPAKVVEIDQKSGRIPVPAATRTYAHLVKDCLVLSAGDHLEIWDSQTFYNHLAENRSRIREATNKLGAQIFSPNQEAGE
ncbi:MAG: division/cell wall cluster transcriptional repressor MraZ [Treponema sp.]|nr:division/cell wall cluster transcriptional repressor MraZ [Treponema sp.]